MSQERVRTNMFVVTTDSGRHHVVKEYQESDENLLETVTYELAVRKRPLIRLSEREFVLPDTGTRLYISD